MEKTCKCGKKFYCIPALFERKKYCSKKCFYKFRFVPIWNKGLKGIHLSPKSEFKKGNKPWNIGIPASEEIKIAISRANKGKRRSIETEFTTNKTKGIKNCKWKGNKVGYFASHGWMQRNFGKATKCENKSGKLGFRCKGISKRYDWAFINRKGFSRDREQYIELCHSCHIIYDKRK